MTRQPDEKSVTIPYASNKVGGPDSKRWVDQHGVAWAVTLNPTIPTNAPDTMEIKLDQRNANYPGIEDVTPEEGEFLAGLNFKAV